MAEDTWMISGPKVVEFDDVTRLKIALVGGQVDIVAHDEPTTRVEVHTVTGKDLKVAFDGTTLEIDHPQLGWDNTLGLLTGFRGREKADVSILVPRFAALDLGVVSASALVSGLTRDATLSTVSGDVQVDGHVGDLTLNAVNGELAVRDHHGDVTAHTVSGDITVAGDIRSLTTDGVSGNVFADLARVAHRLRANTVSGDVTVRLEPGSPAQYTINTVSGRLQLDSQSVTGVRGTFTTTYGELGGSWLDVRVNTVSGDVSVLHAVAV